MIVKVCGITSLQDARMCLGAGADWIGLNLVAGPRKIGMEAACGIAEHVDAGSIVVLARAEDMQNASLVERLSAAGCRKLQVYGGEIGAGLAALAAAGFETLLVQHVAGPRAFVDLRAKIAASSGSQRPDFVVLDQMTAGRQGGTGMPLDWEAVGAQLDADGGIDGVRVILAGGLTAENVADAIGIVRPCGVDVSSGVESSVGVKDAQKVGRFVAAARSADGGVPPR